MWQLAIEEVEINRGKKFKLLVNEQPLSFAEVIELWQQNVAFRAFFISILKEAPFKAFFWETPPITSETQSRPFEFVLIDSPALAGGRPDPQAFKAHCKKSNGDIAVFPNLGKDSMLVTPCATVPTLDYAHLANFVRQAPAQQIHELWKQVGNTLKNHVSAQPVWLSTSGLGVYWLHIRLDTHPKYYQYQPYKASF